MRNPDFYGPPVLLEKEPGLDYLELRIGVEKNRVAGTFRVPGAEAITRVIYSGALPTPGDIAERWRFLLHTSPRVLRGTITGRLVSAARLAFPLPRQRQAVVQLFAVFVTLGVQPSVFDACAAKAGEAIPGSIFSPHTNRG